MKPDVMVKHIGETVIFKTRSKRVSNWLFCRYSQVAESADGHAEIRVPSATGKRLVEELRAAGFNILTS